MPPLKPITIFFSVGEPSGDLHGANLIRQLRERRPDVRTVGYGGPKMAEAGCQLHFELTSLAVMWFARAIANLHTFWNLIWQADRYFRDEKPDAVVLVDFPGLNWWIARRAKARGIPVFYYSPPQIWAWARWRVKKMRRFVDHILCGLPFEESWFRRRGCNATFVGHPFFDEVRRHPYDEQFLADHRGMPGPLVAILPGSRMQEVTHNLRWFLKAAAIVHRRVPEARFALASFKPAQADVARRMIDASGLPIEICVGKTPELMQLADCAMSVSGSVSLELLYHATPTVILYWISRSAYFVQGFFRKVKYITLVNLIATNELEHEEQARESPGKRPATAVAGGREEPRATCGSGEPLFPEYLTCEDKSAEIAEHIVRWLTDPASRKQCVESLVELKTRVAHGGASGRAADYLLDAIGQSPARCDA